MEQNIKANGGKPICLNPSIQLQYHMLASRWHNGSKNRPFLAQLLQKALFSQEPGNLRLILYRNKYKYNNKKIQQHMN